MKHPSYLKGGLFFMGIVLIVLLISVSGAFGMWLMKIGLALGVVTLLYSIIIQIKNALIKPAHRLYAKDFSLKLLATTMGLLLIVGMLIFLFVFYTIGEDSKGTIKFSNAESLFRSLICSLNLFILDVDSNILDQLELHDTLRGWLAVQAVISFGCTILMLVGLVYTRLRAYYTLNYATKINDNRNHLYLFFGDNAPSELLIKDIIKYDPKALAVIIDEANVNEDDNDVWEGIVGLITHKQKVFKTAASIGAYVVVASQRLDDIDDDITAREDFDAFGYLGLSKIKKFIYKLQQTSKPQLHIFFMEEDEELNIRNIIALAKDNTMMAVTKDKDMYHRIYCHARYNGPNRVIQDIALKKHLNIKIVDSSHIAVELLKLDSNCHPVNVVKTSSSDFATVESPLKTLIVGFGEVGRDAFRFLYEFGAFVSVKDTNHRSPFECIIVDSNLDNIKGTLMASMPGIFKSNNGARLGNPSIRFENADCNSTEFYDNVLYQWRFLEEVNYIVISIGKNDEAIALAARIFNQIRRVRDDVSNLRIFVRCTDNNKIEGIQKIADHYNYGYGNGKKNTPVIQVFGQPEKTFTYDLVVSDHLIEYGKLFHEKYRVLSGEGKSWDERHRESTDPETPNIEKLRKLRRQESQNIANALHAGTKIILLENAMRQLYKENGTMLDWPSFYLRYFNGDGVADVEGSKSSIRYPRLSDKENEIILRLAQLEHLRWNAAHELMGYVFNEDSSNCDERTMKHNCLCPWSDLDKQSDRITDWSCDYKRYDFCVVDTTIALYKDNILYPTHNA